MRADSSATSGSSSPLSARQILFKELLGCYVSASISVAAQLKLADHVAHGIDSLESLAAATGMDTDALRRLLRVLCSLEIFVEDEGVYSPTEKSLLLESERSGSLWAIAAMITSPLQWPTLGALLYSIQTGGAAFEHVNGEPHWEFLDSNPDFHDLFHNAMEAFSVQEAQAICDAYDFSDVRLVIDVAGGRGDLLLTILDRAPRAQGILFDIESVVDRAIERLAGDPRGARVQLTVGDMFDHVPSGADLIIMKNIIHNWPDTRALQLLESCANSMGPRTRLLICTRVLKPGNVPDPSKLQDMNMLVNLGGAERTADEFRMLLDKTDLEMMEIRDTKSPLSIIICERNSARNSWRSCG